MNIMKKMAVSAALVSLTFAGEAICNAQQHTVKPDGTYMFVERDSLQLFMDVYYPADGSVTKVDGVDKPTILFVFGGGFKGGRRDTDSARRWFKILADEGYTVAAIDYRLGLKDATEVGLKQAGLLYHAIQIAVEDLFSATNFIIANRDEVDIDPDNIVIAGSSAGAITVLQADYEICNGTELASVLPEGFRYAGVMSFSGAVFSRNGAVRYRLHEPSPTLMFHGTADGIVPYKQIRLFNQAFQGTGVISKEFIRKGYDYNVYRFDGNSHEIAGAMITTFPEQIMWLETNVIRHQKRTVDALVGDPSIHRFEINDVKTLYGGGVNLE